jgi:hypothetical protein
LFPSYLFNLRTFPKYFFHYNSFISVFPSHFYLIFGLDVLIKSNPLLSLTELVATLEWGLPHPFGVIIREIHHASLTSTMVKPIYMQLGLSFELSQKDQYIYEANFPFILNHNNIFPRCIFRNTRFPSSNSRGLRLLSTS